MIGFTQKEDRILESIFNVKDKYYVAKERLLAEVLTQKSMIDQLLIELFCENPDHDIFEKWPETRLAPMRIERIRRKG